LLYERALQRPTRCYIVTPGIAPCQCLTNSNCTLTRGYARSNYIATRWALQRAFI